MLTYAPDLLRMLDHDRPPLVACGKHCLRYGCGERLVNDVNIALAAQPVCAARAPQQRPRQM